MLILYVLDPVTCLNGECSKQHDILAVNVICVLIVSNSVHIYIMVWKKSDETIYFR